MNLKTWIEGLPEVGAFPLWIADKALSLVWGIAVHIKRVRVFKRCAYKRDVPEPWIVIENNGSVPFSVIAAGLELPSGRVYFDEALSRQKPDEELPRRLDPGAVIKCTLASTEYEIWYKFPAFCVLSSVKTVFGTEIIS